MSSTILPALTCKEYRMKNVILLCALLVSSSTAIAAGSFYDLDKELASASKLIYKAQYKKAIEKLEEAIKSEPDNAEAWNLLGYASRKKGDLNTSAKAYNKALSIDPNHKNALEYQGELFLMQRDKTSAESNLAKLQQLCPDGCEQLDELTQAIATHQD